MYPTLVVQKNDQALQRQGMQINKASHVSMQTGLAYPHPKSAAAVLDTELPVLSPWEPWGVATTAGQAEKGRSRCSCRQAEAVSWRAAPQQRSAAQHDLTTPLPYQHTAPVL